MSAPPFDLKQRLRVEMDRALELGGGDAAVVAGFRALEQWERPPEEWELHRDRRPEFRPGEVVNARQFIPFSTVTMHGGWRAASSLIERTYRLAEEELVVAGCASDSIRRAAPIQTSFGGQGYELIVYGTIEDRRQRRLQNFIDGLTVDNAEAAAIAAAHIIVGLAVSQDSWRVCTGAYRDPERRTGTQLAAILATWMHIPNAHVLVEIAHRERNDFRLSRETYEAWRGNTTPITNGGAFTLERFNEAMQHAREQGLTVELPPRPSRRRSRP